jgi:hypothetical protein
MRRRTITVGLPRLRGRDPPDHQRLRRAGQPLHPAERVHQAHRTRRVDHVRVEVGHDLTEPCFELLDLIEHMFVV